MKKNQQSGGIIYAMLFKKEMRVKKTILAITLVAFCAPTLADDQNKYDCEIAEADQFAEEASNPILGIMILPIKMLIATTWIPRCLAQPTVKLIKRIEDHSVGK